VRGWAGIRAAQPNREKRSAKQTAGFPSTEYFPKALHAAIRLHAPRSWRHIIAREMQLAPLRDNGRGLQETAMNMQPKHDPEMGDLRGYAEIVAKPNDIAIGDLPNTDTETDDLRGHEPEPETDPQSDKNRMIIGAVIIAAVVGGIGLYSYAGGMWSAKPPVASVVAAMAVPSIESALAPPQAVVPPVAAVPAAPLAAAAPIEKVRAHGAAPIVKRSAAPSRLAPMPVVPERAPVAPVTASPEITPMTAAPVELDPIAPTPPVQVLPDQPAVQAPLTKPVEPLQ
jgi:hypothetical protein